MLQAGFGRVLVVGYEDGDSDFAQDAFTLLRGQTSLNDNKQSPVTRIGNTEVAYVRATTEEVTSKDTPINHVKGALTGLQHALKGEIEEKQMVEWLGSANDVSFWQYVYLTEPDTILQVRPSALPQLRASLTTGWSLRHIGFSLFHMSTILKE